MAVLLLLMAAVVQMVNGAAVVSTNSGKHLDADSQARLAFDRMAVDFSQIVKRLDVDYYFKKYDSTNLPANGQNPSGGQNDQMAFYSESSGYYPDGVTSPNQKSNASLVGYRINSSYQLERLNKGLVWNGVSSSSPPPVAMTFLPQTLPGTWPLVFGSSSSSAPATPDMSAGTDTDYHVIAEQVFRMEICYLVHYAATATTADYTALSAVPYNPASTATTANPNPTTPLAYNGLRDVVAVVVSLAILDGGSRLNVQGTALGSASGQLGDVTATTLQSNPTQTPAQLWQIVMQKNGLSKAVSGGSLPPEAASQVRIYERYFYLGNKN